MAARVRPCEDPLRMRGQPHWGSRRAPENNIGKDIGNYCMSSTSVVTSTSALMNSSRTNLMKPLEKILEPGH
jgi:hypothetical protein